MIPALIPYLAVLATLVGLMGIAGYFWEQCPIKANRSRWTFLVIFGSLASGCLLAALVWQKGVVPCGLAVAALMLATLWPSGSEWESSSY